MRMVRWFLVVAIVTAGVWPVDAVRAMNDGSEAAVMSLSAEATSHSEGDGALAEGTAAPPASSPTHEQVPAEESAVPVAALLQTAMSPEPTQPEAVSEVLASNITTPIQSEVIAGPATDPPVVVTTFNLSVDKGLVELFNQTDRPVRADLLKLMLTSGEIECEVPVANEGLLMGKSFTRVSLVGLLGEGGDCGFLTPSSPNRVELYSEHVRWQLIDGIASTGWAYHLESIDNKCVRNLGVLPKNLTQQGGAALDYKVCAGESLYGTDGIYVPPTDTKGLMIIEVMTDSVSCAPDHNVAGCYDFIKVKNTSSNDVNLAGYRLRSGASTAASSVTNTFHWEQPTLHPNRDEYVLGPGAMVTVSMRDNGDSLGLTNGDGNVWIEDYYGLMTYQNSSVAYTNMDLAAARGKSWAYNAPRGAWQFGIPSPRSENVMYEPKVEPTNGPTESLLQPCRDDQYRSEETNRCRSIVTATTTTPCKVGQYRSEETNRCRSIVTTISAALKVCADDQFRNPSTGRCKKIASSEELALADCGEGRERNPETNRCRNLKAVGTLPDAAFAVESVKDTTQTFVGWWALGGVGMLALGYGAWEWRREMGLLLGRIGTFFHSGK